MENPFKDWMTIPEAVAMAREQGRRLENNDLRIHCRSRFGPEGLAVYIVSRGIIFGGAPEDFPTTERGTWLVHRSAVEQRLAERARGVGNPVFREPGQPGIPREGRGRKPKKPKE